MILNKKGILIMKKINIKNKKVAVISAAMATIMVAGGAFAYFTDLDAAKNKIEIGNVHIELDEPTWDSTPDTDSDGIPDTADEIVPGKEIPKDPQITNTGKNDAYVYMTVEVPMAEIITANEDGTLANGGAARSTELFTFDANSGWELLNVAARDTQSTIYTYGYTGILKPTEKTATLFDKVTFVNAIEGQGLEDTVQEIDVKAMAIQSEGTGSMKEAYEKYSNQNS